MLLSRLHGAVKTHAAEALSLKSMLLWIVQSAHHVVMAAGLFMQCSLQATCCRVVAIGVSIVWKQNAGTNHGMLCDALAHVLTVHELCFTELHW
jgi:hypothetical protein